MVDDPQCPRCGYDLTGAIASWREACPLEGVCSECGLALLWRDICNEEYHRAPRLFEHARRRRIGSFVRTFLLSVRPWRFWGELRMEHFIDQQRLMFYAAMAPVVAILGELVTWVALASVAAVTSGWGSSVMWLMKEGARIIELDDVPAVAVIVCSAVLGAVLLATMPAAFLLLPQSLRRSKVRRVHLVRIAAYSAPLLAYGVWLQGAATYACFFVDYQIIDLGVWTEYDIVNAIESILPWIVPGAAAVAACIWWAAATRRYLRMPHAWSVAILLTILSSLAVAVPFALAWMLWLQLRVEAL